MSNFRYLDYEGLATYTEHVKGYADGKIVYISDESEIPDPPKEGTLYVIGSEILMDEEIIIGTQTSNTSSWTGKSIDTRLHDGKRIAYYLPYSSVAGAPITLTLELSDEDNTTTPAIRTIYGGSYFNNVISGGSVIRMTYFENIIMNGATRGGWICDGNVAPPECQICDYGNLFADASAAAILPSTLTLPAYIRFVNGGRLLVKFNNNLSTELSGTLQVLTLPDRTTITLTTAAGESTGYKEHHNGLHILDIVMVEMNTNTKYGFVNTFYPKEATTTSSGLMSSSDKSKLDKLNHTPYCTCTTSASSTTKTAAATGFVLATGSVAYVNFIYTNNTLVPTLNIGSTGAKYIKYKGVVYNSTDNTNKLSWNAGGVYQFVYDGTYWVVVGDMPTTSTSVN